MCNKTNRQIIIDKCVLCVYTDCKVVIGMTARELEKILLADGWYHDQTRGSHKYFKHHEKEGKITIPQHKGDVKIKTASTILKQAGLK